MVIATANNSIKFLCPRDRASFESPIIPTITCPKCARMYHLDIQSRAWVSSDKKKLIYLYSDLAANAYREKLANFFQMMDGPSAILQYFTTLPKETNLIYVSELRKMFTDAEIQTLSCETPLEWDYSAPSDSEETNFDWMKKHLNSLIQMTNGNIAYYFYRQDHH